MQMGVIRCVEESFPQYSGNHDATEGKLSKSLLLAVILAQRGHPDD